MADTPTFTLHRRTLDKDVTEVYRDGRYLGLIHEHDGQFDAAVFTVGDIGTADTEGDALNLIIGRTKDWNL